MAPVVHILLPPIVTALAGIRYGVGWLTYKWENQFERPNYTIVEKLGAGVELRRYDAYTVAESHVKNPDSLEAATKVGFPLVYGFIEVLKPPLSLSLPLLYPNIPHYFYEYL